MKRFAMYLAAVVILAGASTGRADYLDYRAQLIRQQTLTRIRLIYAEAQRKLAANNYNDALAIHFWAERESEKVREEGMAAMRALRASTPRPLTPISNPMSGSAGYPMGQPQSGQWVYHPVYGWVFHRVP